MANNVTIEIKLLTAKAGSNVKALAGETKDLKKKVDSATDSIQDNRQEQGKFTSQTKKTTDSVEQQGSGFERLKAKANSTLGKAGLVGLYAGAGLAATAMVSRAVQSGREFEQQLADLEAITGITGEQLEDLADQALETSVKYGESAANIIEANKLVASQLAEKIDFGTAEGAAELSKISEEAIVLQKAAGVDLPTAVKTLTTAINQFNLPASESARIINSIAAGSKFGAAEVANQAEAYKQAGSVAAGANLSFEQLNATVQVLAANAIIGSQAGTNIRGVLLSLQNSAKLAEAGIEGVSLETDGYAGTLEALKPLLNDTIALEKLFGRENIASARILIQNAESVEEMTEKVTGTSVAYKQAAIQMATFNGAQSRLSEAMNSQLIPAFTATGGVSVKLMNAITDLIQEFSGGMQIINDWVDVYSDARKEIDETNRVVGDQISVIRNLRNELALAAQDTTLTLEQQQELKQAYEASSEQLYKTITPLQEKVNLQITERETLQDRLETLKENLGWEEMTEEQLLNTRSAASKLVQEIRSLSIKINGNKTQLKELVTEYNKGQLSLEEFAAELEKSKESMEDLSGEVETLGENYKTNSERIAELINISRDLTKAELEELQSLNKQNEAIEEQIKQRKELAELGADLRPEVANPEPVHVPIEIDIDIPEIELDVPLRSMDEIIKELNKDVSQYVELSGLLGDHSTDNEFAIRRTEEALQDLIANGYHPQSDAIQAQIEKLRELQEEHQKTQEVNYLANFTGEQLAGAVEGIYSVTQGLEVQKQRILERAEADKKAAKSASERRKIEEKAQEQITQAQEKAKEQKKQIIKASVAASITEAAITQFSKVIKTVPFPFNIIAAPIAAAAVTVGMQKLLNFNTGGEVPGPRQERKDTVPAMLTPGEFVIRKDSAAAAPNAMREMNARPSVARDVEAYLKQRPKGFNSGGLVPGPEGLNKDTVPAILTPGEYVVNKKSTQRAKGVLNAINSDEKAASDLQYLIDRKFVLGVPFGGGFGLNLLKRFNASSMASTGSRLKLVGPAEFNKGGLVGGNMSDAAMSRVMNNELNTSTIGVQQNLNMDSLRDEIRSQTEEIKRMTVRAELAFNDFHEAYTDYQEREAQLGRD
jgi:TP901 family phage tail tape measure protein